MRRRDPLYGALLGATAGLVTLPLCEVAIRATLGSTDALLVFGGALLATMFFASSAVVAALFQRSENLRAAMLITYGTKTGLVLIVLGALQLDNSDTTTFVISMFISAVGYLVFQTFYIAKWRRRYRHDPTAMTSLEN